MIVQYKDGLENPVYPRTSARAVIDGNGRTLEEILAGVGSGTTRRAMDFGLPTDVPKVNIVSELLTPDATNNTVSPLTYTGAPTWEAGDPVGSVDTDDVILEFSSQSINFTDRIKINYQGHTSLADAQKAFGIDTANKHKFGKWLEFDSFHLKAFYEDFIKCRDWVCNQMMEQIYMTRKATEERPFLFHNDFGGNYRGFFGSNALCRVDGFPIELYINGVYWGLYVWRLKKHRDNYQFNKSDTDHIFLDAQNWFSNSGAFSWTGVEIRNPKSDSGNPSFPEGVEPNDGPVKTAIVNWETALWGITASTPKSTIEGLLNIKDFIDCYLLMYVNNVWDSWSRNTLYGTWDGIHFSPMVYDMNNSFNGFGGKNTGIYTPYYPPTSNTYNQKARSMPWFVALESIYADEIKARYKELQSLGIFTADNIVGLFDEWAKWVGFNAYGRHAKRWPDCPSYIGTNMDIDSIANIADWVTRRIAYMDSVMA